MANLTIVVPDDILKRARMRALEQGTSVNAVLRDYLGHYAGVAARRERAVDRLLRMSERAQSRRGARKWTRDDLHER